MDDAQRSELEALAREKMREHEIPGAAIGVFADAEETIFALGSAGGDPPRDVAPSTIFQIGSVSKTFTALALMRKVEAGALDLDAPLRRYLPDFRLANPDWAERTTPRHLLTHTASWAGDHDFEERAKHRGEDALACALESLSSAPLYSAPGALFHYSNLAFSVAGRLLETVHGTRFERAVEELVAVPLGLELFFDPEQRPAERVAAGHPEAEVQRSDWPAGGIWCDVRALLRYARAHLGREAVSEETLAAMWAPAVEMDFCPRHMGLAWMLDAIDGCAIATHSGSTRGQNALLELIPDRGYALVALANSGEGGPLCWHAAKWGRERLLDLVAPDPEFIRPSASALRQYCGTYVHSSNATWHVGPREGAAAGELAIRGSGEWETPCPIEFVRPDVFVVSDGDLEGLDGAFVRGADGEIRSLRWWYRLHEREKR